MSRRQTRRSEQVTIKTAAEIDRMRQAGQIHARALQAAAAAVKPGVTGRQLDAIAAEVIAEAGATAPFLGFNGFPAVLCVAVNSAVVHGIPDDQPLKGGDIVGLDLGVAVGGMVVDGAITVPVGEVAPGAARLLEVTRSALQTGLSQIRDGARVGDVSSAIEADLRRAKLGIVRELVGHGVGHGLHEPPEIPNVGLDAGRGPRLQTGMTIAVEPMATLGEGRIVMADDGWTVKTRDGSLAAQFEHTVLVTADGFEVLTTLA